MAEKIVPVKVYLLVFLVLMVLTLTTYRVAFIDLGHLNVVVALAIAFVKATLVALYFMHVRYSSRLTWVVVSGGLVWLVIMIALTLSDYLSRASLNYP
jgi:cytochrome c oxidase subunit 4